jgi:hypothetical protein
MAKIMVYVPDELKRRMDKVKDVKWSPIACAAFEGKLGALAARKEIKNMQDVIQRLRVSKTEHESELQCEGRQHGRDWAMHTASAAELERLQNLIEGPQHGDAFIVDRRTGRSGAEAFVGVIDPDAYENDLDIEQFWGNLGFEDRRYPDDRYVQAFAEAAVEIWREVQRKL